MTFAPRSRRSWIVGRAARMRVSSIMTPRSIGTLKSTRTSTRFPLTSASRTDRFGIALLLSHGFRKGNEPIARPASHRQHCEMRILRGSRDARLTDKRREIGHPARVSPFIVVPGNDLGEIVLDHHGRQGIDD